MAGTYKTFLNNDITSTRTLLHEAIPVTGSIVSGTYAEDSTSTSHVKTFSHGMFESVYDYPYLSSSANHIFDVTVGYATGSALSGASGRTDQEKTINLYKQMALMLMPTDISGNIQDFDEDGNVAGGGKKLEEVFFVNFSRLLVKDEIKKGSFQLELGVLPAYDQAGAVFNKRIKLTDASGSTGFKVNSPAGEYGILYAQTSYDGDSTLDSGSLTGETIGTPGTYPPVGLIYYQAGIVVISGSAVFNDTANGGRLTNTNGTVALSTTSGVTGFDTITGSSIQNMSSYIRNRIYNIQFNNTTELNSTIYFCRANHNEFNYSSNRTYLSGSKIRVKDNSFDQPVSYVTSVGLYSADNELLAVAKLSEPVKKTPDTELTFRVRLDY